VLAKLGQHGALVLFTQHVDEVGNDDAAQVAQAQLPGDGTRGFQVGLENGVVEIARAHVATGVHVHRGECLGLVDDEVAARFEVHTPPQRTSDFLVNRIQVKDRALAFVVLQLGGCGRHELQAKGAQALELLQRIDANALRMLADQVAQHTLQQIEVLVQKRERRQAQRSILDARPGLAQISDVVGQLGVGGVFAIGAQDEAAPAARGLVAHQGLQARAQRLAFAHGYFLRDADMLVLRQKHQQPPGHADLGGEARALAANRVLDDLHHQRLALEHLLFNRHLRLALARQRTGVAVRVALPDIGHMQKRRALQPNVDERRLHARQHARHLAEVDVADQAALERALDVQLLHGAVLDHGHARLLGRPIDQDVLLHGGGAHSDGKTGSAQQLRSFKQRQPHDARIAAAQHRNERAGPPLHRIGAGLAQRFTSGDVGGDLLGRQRCKLHGGHRQRRQPLGAHLQRHGGEHAVAVAGQLAQHARRILCIFGLAINAPAERHRGVRTQDGRCGQAPAGVALHCRIELEAGDTFHIGFGRLAGPLQLDGFGVFGCVALGVGQQKGVAHAKLVQQLAAARALRRKVEEVWHKNFGQIGL